MGKPTLDGLIAIAKAIHTMDALVSLMISDNLLDTEGIKHIANAIKMNVSTYVPFLTS